MASKRQQIIDALSARFAIIATPTYQMNLGAHVFEWRVKPLDSSNDLPSLEYRDMGADKETELNQLIDWRLHMVVKVSALLPADMRKCVSDIYQAIAIDETYGGLAIKTDPLKDEPGAEQEDIKIVASIITFDIVYRAPRWEI